MELYIWKQVMGVQTVEGIVERWCSFCCITCDKKSLNPPLCPLCYHTCSVHHHNDWPHHNVSKTVMLCQLPRGVDHRCLQPSQRIRFSSIQEASALEAAWS